MTALNWAKHNNRSRMVRRGTESIKGASSPPLFRGSGQSATPSSAPHKSKLAEPIIVAEFWCNRRGEAVRVQLREYEGVAILDLRRHYTASDGVLRPTKKGLSIAIRKLPDLVSAINKAEQKARALGLIKPAGQA